MTPRDPYMPEGSPNLKKNTGAYIVREREREYTPIEPMTISSGTTGEHKSLSSPSVGFLVTLSVLLGVIVAGAALLGGIGNAFYVTRSEFTSERTDYAKDKQHFQDENYSVRQGISKSEETLSKQENTLQKIADSVQEIKIDMARRRR